MARYSLDHQTSYLKGMKTARMLARDLTPFRAIRAKCLDCSGGSSYEVRLCVIPECPLYIYRMGHRPKWEGQEDAKGTGDQRQGTGLDDAMEEDSELESGDWEDDQEGDESPDED